MITLIVMTFLVSFGAQALAGLGALGVKSNLSSLMLIVWLLGAFLLRNGYFVLFEFTPRAATPGKRILGLRVASRDGGRLTAEAIFARNAMREIEVFLPLTFLLASGIGATDPIGGWLVLLGLIWTGGFALFPLFNRDRLRIGDLVAGTWVVKSPRQRLSIDLLDAQEAAAGRFAFSAEQAGAYGIKELYVLEDVLRRKDAKTMAAVADRIRGKIGWRKTDGEADDAFLAAYYGALRGPAGDAAAVRPPPPRQVRRGLRAARLAKPLESLDVRRTLRAAAWPRRNDAPKLRRLKQAERDDIGFRPMARSGGPGRRCSASRGRSSSPCRLRFAKPSSSASARRRSPRGRSRRRPPRPPPRRSR